MIVSPVDGCLSQLGFIEEGRIVQAKGHDYSTLELLGGDSALAEKFDGGSLRQFICHLVITIESICLFQEI